MYMYILTTRNHFITRRSMYFNRDREREALINSILCHFGQRVQAASEASFLSHLTSILAN